MIRGLTWIHEDVSPIALDLGHRVVRMLQLSRRDGRPEFIRYAQRELPGGLDGGERHRRQSEAVRDMLARERFVSRNVISSLDWDDLTIRNIRLAGESDALNDVAVVEQAAEQIGLDLSTTEVRYIRAGDVREGTGIGQEVIVLAVARQLIDRHIDGLSSLGLTPVAIDAPPCAIFRAFQQFLRRQNDRETTSAVVDMGYTSSRIIVHRGQDPLYIKIVPIGGARLDELLSQQLDLTVSDAALMRIRMHRYHAAQLTDGESASGELDTISKGMRRVMIAAIRPVLEHLGQEITQCLRYCASTFRGHRTSSVTFVGGEAGNTDMLQLLSDLVNVPFQVGQPLRHAVVVTQTGDRHGGLPEWATVMGLALKPVRASVESL